jgi:hypothetical protein
MKQKILYSVTLCVSGAVIASSPFIMAPAERSRTVSRNEVKESFGNHLHDVVVQSARMQSVVGKMMMQVAALQSTIAKHAGALVEDAPPFDSVSTDKLSKAHKVMATHIEEMATLVESFEKLAARVTATVRLE